MPSAKRKSSQTKPSESVEVVWKGISSSQSKSQKEFNDILKKHKDTLEKAKEVDLLFQMVNSVYLKEVLPEIEKQKRLDRTRFVLMCEILTEEKVSLGKQQREVLRNYLLEICYDNVNEDRKFYQSYMDILETKSERMKRLSRKLDLESRIKNQFGVDVDLDELNRTDFDTEEDRTEHEEKYKEFREKYEEYRSQYHQKRKTSDSKSEKKSKSRLEKEKKQNETERLLSLDINSLFKSLAKQIHPDREQNPELRAKKAKLMTELSGARDNMNIAEILEIKFKVDELVPDNQTDVSFNDSSIKRFVSIIKTKIRKLEDSIKERLFSHPLLEDYPDKRLARPENIKPYLELIAKNNKKITDSFEEEVERLKREPKYVKEMIRDLSQVGY
ncbi:hypothetical protein [Leptospira idonii]|uniref:Molecular chaperone DnaJ n=1 Tax=Leptospira idonii TaxID=1193500 RepID=A0A4R9LZA6_9LEPT|nr:hypothetical protein [Leptospira idonii]TGN19754.1 hypothetical protein EHS15_08250 [Leptospira idonii]